MCQDKISYRYNPESRRSPKNHRFSVSGQNAYNGTASELTSKAFYHVKVCTVGINFISILCNNNNNMLQ